MSNNQSINSLLASITSGMADAVEEIAGLTVLVNARKRLPVSGLLLRPTEIVTVDHGVEKEDDIEIIVQGTGLVKGKLVGRDPGTDLAVIRLDKAITGLVVARPATARVGMPVMMVGRPEPTGHQASFGIITMVGSGLRTIKGSVLEHYIATDAIPYPGFSGGALMTLEGGWLGVNTSGLVGGMSLAVPASLVMSVFDQISQYGRVKRGYVGIRSQQVEIPAGQQQSLPDSRTSGLLVVGVEQGGPAESSGIMVGDILIGADTTRLATQDDLVIYLTGDVSGKEIEVQLIRGGELKRIHLRVGER